MYQLNIRIQNSYKLPCYSYDYTNSYKKASKQLIYSISPPKKNNGQENLPHKKCLQKSKTKVTIQCLCIRLFSVTSYGELDKNHSMEICKRKLIRLGIHTLTIVSDEYKMKTRLFPSTLTFLANNFGHVWNYVIIKLIQLRSL